MGANFSTNKQSKGWAVTRSNSKVPASIHATQTGAWAEARRLARGANSDAVLRNSDGKVQTINSYGKGPFQKK
jgi:hypothetical protein